MSQLRRICSPLVDSWSSNPIYPLSFQAFNIWHPICNMLLVFQSKGSLPCNHWSLKASWHVSQISMSLCWDSLIKGLRAVLLRLITVTRTFFCLFIIHLYVLWIFLIQVFVMFLRLFVYISSDGANYPALSSHVAECSSGRCGNLCLPVSIPALGSEVCGWA